ncbi:MAG: uroporphyrinogen-III synthase [Deferribacteraceae bacterium]|jgi:uroporphyrinogen-III synthase|nr:uroporphyrinogen-III synthase [Deferribacteraceae bacterium]
MNVLITRAAEQIAETINIFSFYGLSPYCMPMIQSVALQTPEFKYRFYDYCILTSPTAVRYFAPHGIGASKYAAVGAATAKAIKELLKVPEENIYTPENAYVTEIEKFFAGADLTGKKVTAPGARERIKDLGAVFQAKDLFFESPALYETAAVQYAKGEVESTIDKYHIEAVTFFSPSAVNAFFRQTELSGDVITAAIGSTTAKSLSAIGRTPVCGREQTAESLARALKINN